MLLLFINTISNTLFVINEINILTSCFTRLENRNLLNFQRKLKFVPRDPPLNKKHARHISNFEILSSVPFRNDRKFTKCDPVFAGQIKV